MPRRQYLVTAALIRRDDYILLVQQQGPADPAPTWALPGGVVEEGELLTEALIREVCEETGLVVTEVGPLAYVTELDHARNETHSLAFVFEVIAWSGHIHSNDPDNVIVGAEFWGISDTITKVQMLPVMREPLIAYLTGAMTQGSVWLYRQLRQGSEQRIAMIQASSDRIGERGAYLVGKEPANKALHTTASCVAVFERGSFSCWFYELLAWRGGV